MKQTGPKREGIDYQRKREMARDLKKDRERQRERGYNINLYSMKEILLKVICIDFHWEQTLIYIYKHTYTHRHLWLSSNRHIQKRETNEWANSDVLNVLAVGGPVTPIGAREERRKMTILKRALFAELSDLSKIKQTARKPYY